MNMKLFLSTFLVIFLAELGDKTQLAVVGRAAEPSARWTVFAAASLALVASTLVAVQFGHLLAKILDPRTIKLGAGVLFLVIGALVLLEGVRGPSAAAATAPVGAFGRFVLAQAAAFERDAFADYRVLADQVVSPELRALLQLLADEEEEHFRRVGELRSNEPEEAGAAPPPPGVPQHLPLTPLPAGDATVLERAIAHERSTAAFYRELAQHAMLAPLRRALGALAESEEQHVARLLALQSSGAFALSTAKR